MATTETTTTTTLINIPTLQRPAARSRSSTESAIKRTHTYHTGCLSADASTLSSGTERDSASTVSSPPGATKPAIPLRRKHNWDQSGIPKSPTVPIFHKKAVDNNTKVHKSGTAVREETEAPLPSTPLLRTSSNASTTDGRSPGQKRAPASHSSYGIETSCGPPPSFSTQQTLSQDRLWKPPPIEKLDNTSPSDALAQKHESREKATRDIDRPSHSVQVHTMEAIVINAGDLAISSVPDNSPKQEVQTQEPASPMAEELGKDSSSDEHKSEDLFLKIAKEPEQPDSAIRAERRRSRISLPYLSGTRPSTAHSRTTSPEQGQLGPAVASPSTEVPRFQHKRASLGQHTSAMSAHPLDAPRRQRYFSHNAARAPSEVQRTVEDRPKYPAPNTTESTISTTAPSTVWDELDDLKSRIKKLELTGKLPPSSAAAMSTIAGERPRTATTNATTMSASPKHAKASISPVDSAIDGIPSSVHPLLHEALIKAKPVIRQEVYQKLTASASDALQLASMMSNSNGLASVTERQIRRRADSMCRGLTELAIALSSETHTTAQSTRPPSRSSMTHLNSPAASGLTSRRLSNDPSDRQLPQPRVQSRLDSRRTSQLYSNTSRVAYSSPDTVSLYTPPSVPHPMQPASSSRLNRSSVLRNRHHYGAGDGGVDSDDGSPSIASARPPSRALTDVAQRSASRRYTSRDQSNISREYTSQHPMPTAFEEPLQPRSALPPGISSGLVSRRVSGSPGSVLGGPTTPREGLGRRYFAEREASAPPNSADNTPESVTVERGSGTRRSFGLAGRITSNVGSRLRAVRAEKQQSKQQSAQREIRELQQESESLAVQQVQ